MNIHLYNGKSSAFQAAYGCCIFVRRSSTCGYEGYCLSGKSKPVNWRLRLRWIFLCIRGCFWLEKPNFHNRRIYSAAWIVVGNLPERQYFYLPRRLKDAKLASSSEYHNPCTAWRQCLSPYLKGTVIWQVWSNSPLKIRGVPPKAGRCYELMDNG